MNSKLHFQLLVTKIILDFFFFLMGFSSGKIHCFVSVVVLEL